MFQSKRMLLGNYYTFQDKQMKIKRENDDKELLLYDEERDNKYPVFEDFNGTHIMSPNDICLIEELEPLFEAGIDSFKIDGNSAKRRIYKHCYSSIQRSNRFI